MTDQTEKVAYVAFNGVIEFQSVSKIAATFNQAVNDGYTSIYFCFNSPGGIIGDGIALYNHLRGLPVKITVHNIGSVSSVAVCIFMAGAERLCSSHAMFMMHPVSTPIPKEGQSWHRLQASLEAALADEERLDDILCSGTGLTKADLAPRRFGDIHIGPQRAVDLKIAHRIAEFALPRGQKIFQI